MNFTFNESTHIYTLDGRRLISVTQALSILDNRWKIDKFYLERGHNLHKAIELYNRDELDEDSVDNCYPPIRPYFDARIKFGRDTGFKPIYFEKIFYHPKYFYAGRIDEIGILNGSLSIIDDKSGTPAKVDELQDVAYWELAKVNNIPVEKLFDLYLKENGTYKLEPVERPRNLLPVFLACLTAVRWREGL